MRSLLGAEHYTSPEIFEREQERIFRRLWIFAGPKTLLNEPDSFITRTIGGVPVVVQNFGGEIKAFVNRCAHRQSAIQIGDHGVRRLACPYHGWVYDPEGKVASIPSCDALYGFDAETRASRRLDSVSVECVGNCVFVNLDRVPMPIDRQFHRSFLDRLAHVTSYFDDEVLLSRFDARFNWKLIHENILDFNHIPYIHAQSFAKLLPAIKPDPSRPPARIGPPPADTKLGSDLRDLSFAAEAPFEFRHWPWHDNVERFSDEARYFNFYLYPNVNLTAIAGVFFPIQQFNPVATDCTDYTMWLMTGRQKRPNPATPAILWSQAKGEKSVIDEDVRVLEAMQRGFGQGSHPAFHGSYETHLRTMARVYLEQLA
jgi:phenylpropionate dioxygenase-like ring-hydroxylating dioxygenase large terminal subunit